MDCPGCNILPNPLSVACSFLPPSPTDPHPLPFLVDGVDLALERGTFDAEVLAACVEDGQRRPVDNALWADVWARGEERGGAGEESERTLGITDKAAESSRTPLRQATLRRQYRQIASCRKPRTRGGARSWGSLKNYCVAWIRCAWVSPRRFRVRNRLPSRPSRLLSPAALSPAPFEGQTGIGAGRHLAILRDPEGIHAVVTAQVGGRRRAIGEKQSSEGVHHQEIDPAQCVFGGEIGRTPKRGRAGCRSASINEKRKTPQEAGTAHATSSK